MSKYVIAKVSDCGGITQTLVKAESKLKALLEYFDIETDQDGHLYLDVESLLADVGYELGYDINILKVSKTKKELDPDYSPWPFPTTQPE
jgi:hypothetical protein